MKVLVGSQNPVKIEAVKEAFSKFFDNVDVVGLKVNSRVPNQPVNSEIFEGARNRALELKRINAEKKLNADFFVGIEGGIAKQHSKWFAFGGMCVIDKNGREGFGTSPQFEVPETISTRLLNGTELGDIADELTGQKNTKQKGGAVAFLTKDVINRKDLYVAGLIVGLIPFINEKLYFEKP